MNELKAVIHNDQKVIDSRDVAQMIGRSHNELLKSIRLYAEHLNEGAVPRVEFFIDNSYIDAKGQVRPCYLITKKGCDMIANKLAGKKGTLFTAAYVTAFEEMNEQLKALPSAADVSPGGLADLIRVNRRIMLDVGSSARDIVLMAQAIYKTWNVPVPPTLVAKVDPQLSLFDRPRVLLSTNQQEVSA